MKHPRLYLCSLLLLTAHLLTSCSRVPKHAKYIPKDAFMVLGVHTGKMGKNMAWNAIAGGGMLSGMNKVSVADSAPAAFKDLNNSGLDFTSTLYFYNKPDTRFQNQMKIAAVLPVANTLFVENYFKKHFPSLPIRSANGLKEVIMDGQYYFAWNDEVLVAMNPIVRQVQHQELARVDTVAGTPIPVDPFVRNEYVSDSVATLAELEASFKPASAAGINDNERFKELEKAGHDISLYLNYDPMADMAASKNIDGMGMMGTTIGSSLFKGSAMTAGFDFETGRVDGLMRYFASDSMKPVAKEFAKENVDGDMLRRLPAPGLNMAGGYHLSPAAIKLLLEKMNLSGMANLALMSQGLSLDDILGSFTGDMVFAVNNFRVEQRTMPMDTSMQGMGTGMAPYASASPNMDFVFAMKIGDRNRLNKLLSLAGRSQMLTQVAPNTYALPGIDNRNTLVISDKYIAAGNNVVNVQAFLKERGGAMPDAVHKEISGHPVGMWANLQSVLSNAGFFTGSSPSDSAAVVAIRNTLSTFSMQGGEYKDGANEYTLKLNMVNKTENSLPQIVQMAQQLAAFNRAKLPSAI